MADIYHDFYISVTPAQIYRGIASPSGLDTWWTEKSSGKPNVGELYNLGFGPGYDWEAIVTRCTPAKEFELKMTKSDADWDETKIGFSIKELENGCQVEFRHTGWHEINEHYRISSFCWAMYLRILKLNLENGLTVPYAERLNV